MNAPWLHVLAITSLVVAAACALIVAIHVAGHRQNMWIMNVVWPVTALWSGPFGLWAYFRYGTAAQKSAVMQAKRVGRQAPMMQQPLGVLTGKAATHCGAGCTLGDVIAEGVAAAAPWRLFGFAMFGAWVYDFVAAFLLGIGFQYFTIKPMKHLSPGQGLWAALKADTLSLTAWQLGMYGWMAFSTFALFHRELPKSSPLFWFMMQVAMFFGFFTSYPLNRWLLRKGLKEKM
jgi:hypothetical protein